MINGEIWAVAKDVALLLGYERTRDAISQHCENALPASKLFNSTELPNTSLDSQTKLINEEDIERLKSRCCLNNEPSVKHLYLILNPYTKQHKIGVIPIPINDLFYSKKLATNEIVSVD